MDFTNIAVVGASGGIGAYLAHRWGARSFRRGDSMDAISACSGIVFCAAKARFETPTSELYSSIEDNFLLLERMTQASIGRPFVYFSSCDVYPKSDAHHQEDEDINIEALSGGYPSFKLMAEAIVRERLETHAILRPTSLFGAGMRPNNIIRLLTQETPKLSLAAESRFNCVTYSMVGDLIQAILKNGVKGIFNCAAAGDVSLNEIATMVDYKGPFGKHRYQVPNIANHKAADLVPAFNRSSADIVADIHRAIIEGATF